MRGEKPSTQLQREGSRVLLVSLIQLLGSKACQDQRAGIGSNLSLKQGSCLLTRSESKSCFLMDLLEKYTVPF